MKRSLGISVALLSLLCILWVPGALGQAVYGSILGTVIDPSGAAVSGAKITVTSQAKNVSTVWTWRTYVRHVPLQEFHHY